MTRVKTLDGKSYSGNPRGRSDEECLAPEVTQKCASRFMEPDEAHGGLPIEFRRRPRNFETRKTETFTCGHMVT